MSGIKGMHARLSTSPAYAEKVRARIKAGGIVFLLQKHVAGKLEMTSTQVQAALGLLKKVVPDQTAIEHSIDPANVEAIQGFGAWMAATARGEENADGAGVGEERSVFSTPVSPTAH